MAVLLWIGFFLAVAKKAIEVFFLFSYIDFMSTLKRNQQAVVARAYKVLDGDFDILQRALAYLRYHHPKLEPSVEDVVWAAEYVRRYDDDVEAKAPKTEEGRNEHFAKAYVAA